VLIIRFLLLLMLAAPAWAALDGRKQELEGVRERIAKLKQEIEQASEDRVEVADALKQSERNISEVNRSLRELRQQQKSLGRQLDDLALATRQTQAELDAQREQLAELLRQRYMQGGGDTLKLLLNAQDPQAIARNLEYLRYVGQARNELIRDYQSTLERLRALETDTRQKNDSLRRVRDDQLIQKKRLEKDKVERQAVLDKLAKQIRSQRREVSTLVRDEQRLARLIERLSRVAPPVRQDKRPLQPGRTVAEVADASLAKYAFATLKGRLALPLAGEIVARFGQPREGGGPAWKGLFIRAPEGRQVRAVGSGQVAFADWLRGFGNLLIIDHGGCFLSLYSNNESLYKQVGDSVRAGDTIASVGNSGGQEEAGLYFELRHQGRPFDPLSWVKLK
jgi:septal ring factor EnvC (AmiA/AmiB activator)